MAFRLSYIAVEAYRGFRRNLLLAISMVIIVAISLTLFGIALLAGKQVSLFGGYWSDKIEVSVFLAPKIPAQQRDDIRRQLEEDELGFGILNNGATELYVVSEVPRADEEAPVEILSSIYQLGFRIAAL